MKKKRTIAIIDDDADDRDIIRDAFAVNAKDVVYTCMENSDRLMEYLESTSDDELPDLILIDLNMPGKDGREAIKEIKGSLRLKTIPVIVLTTSSSARDRQTSYLLGTNCFITKPDTFNKLVELAHSVTRLWLPEA